MYKIIYKNFWKDFVVEQNLAHLKGDFWSYLNRLHGIVVVWDDWMTGSMDPWYTSLPAWISDSNWSLAKMFWRRLNIAKIVLDANLNKIFLVEVHILNIIKDGHYICYQFINSKIMVYPLFCVNKQVTLLFKSGNHEHCFQGDGKCILQ